MAPKYFEEIKDNHLYEFLKQNNIQWNKIVATNLATLIMPENVARIAENSKKYELYLSYQGLSDFFTYQIDEHFFVLANEQNDININLSLRWQKFLREFKKENQIEDEYNI